MKMIVDKMCNQQVLGCLMKHPQFLSNIDKYSFTLSDFSSRFEKYIYSAILGLYRDGATAINPVDVDNYLNVDKTAHTIFTQSNGVEYLQDAAEFSEIDNFSFYYNKFKKLNLLRDLQKQGFDVSDYYVEDLLDPNADNVNSKFEQLTTKDIIDGIKRKVLHLETGYVKTGEVEVFDMADGIDEFINETKETFNIGLPLQEKIYSKIIAGAQLTTLTIRSACSGCGKTRMAVGDACKLAYPISYNSFTCKWEITGSNEKVLFIITEQTEEQLRRMVLAYLTDINESRFKYTDFSEDEQRRISIAAMIIKKFPNLVVIKMPNPTIELTKTMIRETCLTHNVRYVFFDYIFINPSLLNEFHGFSLRNDEVLLMFATALKDLAVELNVAMFTSTQVNASADETKNIRNEASLAGGRSTINKADNGAILARPTKEEIEILSQGGIITKYGRPNLVLDVYKVRNGQWTQVRIWILADLGRLKFVDLFVTDANLDPIQDIFDEPEYEVVNWEDEDYQKFKKMCEELNNPENGVDSW